MLHSFFLYSDFYTLSSSEVLIFHASFASSPTQALQTSPGLSLSKAARRLAASKSRPISTYQTRPIVSSLPLLLQLGSVSTAISTHRFDSPYTSHTTTPHHTSPSPKPNNGLHNPPNPKTPRRTRPRTHPSTTTTLLHRRLRRRRRRLLGRRSRRRRLQTHLPNHQRRQFHPRLQQLGAGLFITTGRRDKVQRVIAARDYSD